MALTAAQIAALQAEAEARRAEADALAATAFAGYTAGYHAFCAEVDDEVVNIPCSPYSAALLFLETKADWKTALDIGQVPDLSSIEVENILLDAAAGVPLKIMYGDGSNYIETYGSDGVTENFHVDTDGCVWAKDIIQSDAGVVAPYLLGESFIGVTAGAAGIVPLSVKGAVDQSANLQEWKDSNDVVKAYVKPDGTLHVLSLEVDVGASGAHSDAITALDALTPASHKLPYYTGADSAALVDISDTALSLLGVELTAPFDFFVGSGAGTVVKKTLAETKSILGIGSGSGDMLGPGASVVNNIMTWEDTLGIHAKDSGVAIGLIPQKASTAALSNSMALVTDGSGKVVSHSNVSATELGYLDGVTSAIQTQLNAKQAAAKLDCGYATGSSIAQTDKTINFNKTFANAPKVVTNATNSWSHVRVKSTTTTGFVANASLANTTFFWIAMEP